MARKTNKALTKWVAFVKKVQKEEKIGYSEAMKRAKVRKDHGEKWMGGGGDMDDGDSAPLASPSLGDNGGKEGDGESKGDEPAVMEGGRRRRSKRRGSHSRSRSRRRGKRGKKTRRR